MGSGFEVWVLGSEYQKKTETKNKQIILYTIWKLGHHHEESNTSLWLEDEEKIAKGVTITITSPVRDQG